MSTDVNRKTHFLFESDVKVAALKSLPERLKVKRHKSLVIYNNLIFKETISIGLRNEFWPKLVTQFIFVLKFKYAHLTVTQQIPFSENVGILNMFE